MSEESTDDVSRRRVLRASAGAAGAVSLTAAAGTVAGFGGALESNETPAGERRGGRAQVDGEVRQNEPFTLSYVASGIARNASCMADESAEQLYLEYDVQYCDDDDDETTLYVLPEAAELASDEVYEFRAVQECRDSENDMVAFGPSNGDHDC